MLVRGLQHFFAGYAEVEGSSNNPPNRSRHFPIVGAGTCGCSDTAFNEDTAL